MKIVVESLYEANVLKGPSDEEVNAVLQPLIEEYEKLNAVLAAIKDLESDNKEKYKDGWYDNESHHDLLEEKESEYEVALIFAKRRLGLKISEMT
jgi:hypothetical protein